MAETEDTEQDGIYISDKEIGKFVRKSGGWLLRVLTRKGIAPAVAIIGLGGGSAAGYAIGATHGSTPATTAATSATVGPLSQVHISLPASGNTISRCVLVVGIAKITPGDGIWVLIQGEAPRTYYIEGPAELSTSTAQGEVDWSFRATIGGISAPGSLYTIVAAVLNPDMANYLQGMENATTLKSDYGQLADNALPPGTSAEDTAAVVRGSDVSATCPR